MIKTKEWLIQARQSMSLTQQELAKLSGVTVSTIQNIEQGKRIGSVQTWEKLNGVLSDAVEISYACDELIVELHEELALNPSDTICYLYYELCDGIVLFVDYALERDLDDPNFEPLENEKMMQSTLGQALEIFTYQNKIFK